MTANEYQKAAMRTKSNSFSDKELMVNAALGLAGETAEYLQSSADNNIDGCKKELGDIEWYIALMCDVFDFDLSQLIECRVYTEGKIFNKQVILSVLAGRICDQAKKVYFQGHIASRSDMFLLLVRFQNFTLDICDDSGFDIEEIWELNIEKLLKRYPDGFDADKSINREV